MNNFISRHKELEFLNGEYEKNSSSLIVLYGRRRIGKTTLTSEFGKDKNILYFLATEESENQHQFKNLVGDFTKNELLQNVTIDGRRTGQIRLKQIPFSDYHEFFENKSRKDLIEYYSVTGGVPKYIELFYESNNIFSAIENNILSKQSFLYEEPMFLLQNEVSEVGNYFSIIKTIAAGNKKLSKIATALENNLIDNHVSYVYEDICIEEMWKLNSEDKWNFNFDKVGRFWNNTTKIDIVAFDSNDCDIIFGECKYREQKLDIDVFYALLDKAKEVDWKKGNRREWYVLFSINGFTDKMQELAKSRDDIVLCT